MKKKPKVRKETRVLVTLEEERALDLYMLDEPSGITYYLDNHDMWTDDYKPLADMGLEKFIRAVENGYYVEEPILVGDWIMNLSTGLHGKVDEIIGEKVGHPRVKGVWYGHNGQLSCKMMCKHTNVRKSTPQEIEHITVAIKQYEMWNKAGRGVGEFLPGDIYQATNGITGFVTINNTEAVRELYSKGEIVGFFPKESFISVYKEFLQ